MSGDLYCEGCGRWNNCICGGKVMAERKCERCGEPRTDNVESNICGSCADDLRSEQDTEAEDYHQRQLREAYGNSE